MQGIFRPVNMCKTKDFCCCLPLKGGLYAALFFSIIFLFSLLAFAIFNVRIGSDKDDYFKIIEGFLIILLILFFGIGTISLAITAITDKVGLTIIWLITSMVFLIFSFLVSLFMIRDLLVLPTAWEAIVGYVEMGLVLCFDAFLLYLWIVVLNYYWVLKRKKWVEEEEAA